MPVLEVRLSFFSLALSLEESPVVSAVNSVVIPGESTRRRCKSHGHFPQRRLSLSPLPPQEPDGAAKRGAKGHRPGPERAFAMRGPLDVL